MSVSVSCHVSRHVRGRYANMTRFQWAYPSGVEDEKEQWVSGPMMVLAVVIMNMLYLVAETRTRVGEPGINDPATKVSVTIVTYIVLLVLIQGNYIDPSDWAAHHRSPPPPPAPLNGSAPPSAMHLGSQLTNPHLPLLNVCATQQHALVGIGIFASLAVFCLGFVIFGTSAQSLSGLRLACACCCCRARPGADPTLTGSIASSMRASSMRASSRRASHRI